MDCISCGSGRIRSLYVSQEVNAVVCLSCKLCFNMIVEGRLITLNNLLNTYQQAGSVTVSPSLRDGLKEELDELGIDYTECWDESNKFYVFKSEEESK